jgi:hypothetical protein
LDTCEACAIAKAQQKKVSKVSKTLGSEHPNDRVFIDLAFIKAKPNMPVPTSPHWLIIVDDHTKLKHVEFFNSKNGIVEYLRKLSSMTSNDGVPVKFVRRDNEQEIFGSSQDCRLEIEYIFELTFRSTSQHNSRAGTGFQLS